jgi:hypothetical protein
MHCIGGFVFTYFYGLPRTTGDIDYYAAIPANLNLDEVAGQGSPLHAKQGSVQTKCATVYRTVVVHWELGTDHRSACK